MASRMAWTEPARHSRHARLRRGYAMARVTKEGSRVDSLHRRYPHGSRLCGPDTRRDPCRVEAQGGTELSGHVHQRKTLCVAYIRQHAKRADEETRVALHGQQRLFVLSRQKAQARIAIGKLRGLRY